MKRIGIVEDEAFIREELGEILEKAGYEVVAVEDFEKVEEKLSKAPLDLVLLDLNLPGKSGFQICRELKHKGTTPVCVLTSRDQMADELRALELGADEYLTKPCRKERLLARVSNVLKRYEGRKHLLEGKNFCWISRHIHFISMMNRLSCQRIRENYWKYFLRSVGRS